MAAPEALGPLVERESDEPFGEDSSRLLALLASQLGTYRARVARRLKVSRRPMVSGQGSVGAAPVRSRSWRSATSKGGSQPSRRRTHSS